MNRFGRFVGLALAGILIVGAWDDAGATTLSASMTMDNAFETYLSTSDSTLGTLIGSGSSWPTTYSFSAALSTGVTNYLHVVGHDYGVISAFIGQFSLSDAAFSFSNGTQVLVTNTTNWGVNLTGFGSPYSMPISYGLNGASPWGMRPGISSSAQFIWDPSGCTYCTAYFSTAITPNVPVVPEPGGLFLLGSSLAGLAAWRRIRQ